MECNSIADATLLNQARLTALNLQRLASCFDVTRNLKIVLAYDGSEFSGWQVQPDAATIQGTLASAIGRVTGEKVLPQASGRTDAGVHALAQVATFVTESPMPARNLVKALNDILPPSIRVIESNDAPLRVSRAQVLPCENLPLPHLSRRHLFSLSGALRLALSLSP